MRKYCTHLVVFFTLLMSKNAAAQITCPADFTVERCYNGDIVEFTGDHAATVTGTVEYIVYSYSDASGSGSSDGFSNDPFLVLSYGEHIITATASYTGGTTESCTFKVTVAPPPALTITCPADFTVERCYNGDIVDFTGDHAVTVTGTVEYVIYSYSDASGSGSSDGFSNNPYLALSYGEHIITATAYSYCSVSPASCTFKVTVAPPPALTITCPADFTVERCYNGDIVDFTGDQAVTVTGTVEYVIYSYSDASGSGSSDGFSNNPYLALSYGEHIITATAYSYCSVSPASCTFKVTVAPPPALTITCPADFTVERCYNGDIVDFTGDQAVTVTGTVEYVIYSYSDASGSGSSDGFSNNPYLALSYGEHIITATAYSYCSVSPASCTFKVTVSPPTVSISCPADFTVFANPSTCNALVTFTGNHAASSQGPVSYVLYSYSDASGSGTTDGFDNNPSLNLSFGEHIITATTSAYCDAPRKSCTFKVTVAPDPNDIVFICPGPVTVGCAKDVPTPNTSAVTISYTCATLTVEYVDDVISNQTCANRYTITRTFRVKEVPSVTCSQTITVFDNSPPVISNVSVSSATLWPPNHKMQTVTVGYDVSDNCGATSGLSVSSNQPINGTGDGDTSPDWVITDANHVQLRAERGNSTDGRIYTITVTANDGCNAASTATTTVTVAHNINSPVTGTPFKIGSTVNFSGVFWDKPANKHTAAWLINDNTSVKGIVTEPSGTKNGKVTGSYKFGSTGIYRLQMNVTDQNKVTSYANTNEDLEEIIVIYDPNGGYAYGGGNFASPKGALVSNPSATGKVTYGFTVNYYKGATLPKGQTQFNFNVGGFKYDAVNFDYLSVVGYKAVFKGSGKILGGPSGINFIMYVIDGALDGSGVDKVRLKIYNKNTSQVYYDNEPGKSDAADPVTKVGVNSQVVISGTPVVTQAKKIPSETLPLATELTVRVYPNPTQNLFALQVESANQNDQIILQVFDLMGRLVEKRAITQGLTDRIGNMYKPGTYLFRVIQGNDHKEFKVLKLPGLIF